MHRNTKVLLLGCFILSIVVVPYWYYLLRDELIGNLVWLPYLTAIIGWSCIYRSARKKWKEYSNAS